MQASGAELAVRTGQVKLHSTALFPHSAQGEFARFEFTAEYEQAPQPAPF